MVSFDIIVDKVGIISFPAFKSKCGEYENKKVIVSGWGMTDDNGKTFIDSYILD